MADDSQVLIIVGSHAGLELDEAFKNMRNAELFALQKLHASKRSIRTVHFPTMQEFWREYYNLYKKPQVFSKTLIYVGHSSEKREDTPGGVASGGLMMLKDGNITPKVLYSHSGDWSTRRDVSPQNLDVYLYRNFSDEWNNALHEYRTLRHSLYRSAPHISVHPLSQNWMSEYEDKRKVEYHNSSRRKRGRWEEFDRRMEEIEAEMDQMLEDAGFSFDDEDEEM